VAIGSEDKNINSNSNSGIAKYDNAYSVFLSSTISELGLEPCKHYWRQNQLWEGDRVKFVQKQFLALQCPLYSADWNKHVALQAILQTAACSSSCLSSRRFCDA